MMGGIIYGCAINTAKEQWIIKGFKHFNFSMLTLLMGYTLDFKLVRDKVLVITELSLLIATFY